MSSQAPAGNLISRFFAASAKRVAVKFYLTGLPRQLLTDFGHTDPFTPAQVESALRRRQVSDTIYRPYALAIFCEREPFDALARERGEAWDYEALRAEVGRAHFRKPDFILHEVGFFADASGGSWDSGGSHGGGHHGGGGGHH